MVDVEIWEGDASLYFLETTPLLRQFLPPKQPVFLSYEAAEIKDTCNVTTETTNSTPTFSQRSSSEESLDDSHMTEHAIPPMQDNIVIAHATYWKLLRTNRPYLFYIISYFLDRIGEWFTYVATNAISHASSHSNTAVAAIIAIRTIPNIVFSSVGGGLADSTDRRDIMIFLNITGMFVALLYLPAYHFKSLPLIYIVAFIQASVAAIYDPVRRSIIPLLVPEEDYLQKATTMSEIAFATMASVGATLGGITASTFGVSVCSVVDSVTYLLSAYLMWLVGGEWTVAKGCVHSHNPFQLLIEYKDLVLEGFYYLATCSFALLVTLKSSCAIIIGGADVLNVQLSHQAEDEDRDSTRLGILLAMFGLGFFIGPLVSDRFISMKHPRSILGACVIGFALIFMGFIGMGLSTSFHSICFSTVIRGSGSSVLWINSTLLLQKFSQEDMLGRVMSIDYALSTLFTSSMAFVAGALEDQTFLSPNDVCLIMAVAGFLFFVAWGIFFLFTSEKLFLPEMEEINEV